MIVVNIACGLANRMFQFSYYLYLRHRGYDVRADAYQSGKLAHESVAWNQIFPYAPIDQVGKFKAFCLGGGNDLFSRFRRRFLPCTTNVLQMPTAFDVLFPEKSEGDKYIIGVFQNAQMVEEIRDDVLQAYRFTPFEDAYNRSFEEQIKGCESVGIHVRKGADYQSRIWYQNTCPVEYYLQAVKLMREKLGNPRFFVFADNKEWVKENLKGFEYTLVDGNPGSGYGSHFDLQLMSYCKHNIISNSTYSWWGAFLNKHEEKIVVMPKIWFNPASCEEHTSNRLQCTNWIQL